MEGFQVSVFLPQKFQRKSLMTAGYSRIFMRNLSSSGQTKDFFITLCSLRHFEVSSLRTTQIPTTKVNMDIK
ncbi:CLUMA_CG003909, isoform A [Clunio marinus]|uniref:CLUMA_CG003909, isoform A n=1 Tax=Clunio marinus TaxID=568069 RepID=A0A1J1HQD9_9DIPT|nr:CLUMA_CG003909, isoform A [Clunio marinus]